MSDLTKDLPSTDSETDVELDQRPTAGMTFEKILNSRLKRREFLAGAAATAATVSASSAMAGNPLLLSFASGQITNVLTFAPFSSRSSDTIELPEGYTHDVIIRWGDSLFSSTADLDVAALADGRLLEPGAGAEQAERFGYNCDATEFFSMPNDSKRSESGLVCVNHEYTNDELMFPGWSDAVSTADFVTENTEVVPVMQAAHGVSVVEIQRSENGSWEYVVDSRFNRRLTANSFMDLTGPAAGHPLLITAQDPTGTLVKGTLNNCSGGRTPWGTFLTAEENFDQYFGRFDDYVASADADPEIIEMNRRIPLPGGGSRRAWEAVDSRFDLSQNPTESFRFGWVVEIDPFNPMARPKKRTAMGRFKHECATGIQANSGQMVVYSGDDARMEYVYKFVSTNKVSAQREENEDLLDDGILYVARLNDDGSGEWLPLVWGEQPALQSAFPGQAEVLINTRAAADLLGATPMDRPEDVEANPVTKKVYVACTNNTRRTFEPGSRNFQGRELPTEPSITNPRGPNRWGHVIEITEANNDNSAESFVWEIFLLCGDPQAADGEYLTDLSQAAMLPLSQDTTYYGGFEDPTQVAILGSPDNLNFDNLGNLWIVTDGSQPTGGANGTFVVPTFGEERGKLRQFMSGPRDCEVCGCEFTPDGNTLFLAIQHPGDGGDLSAPSSYWPDSTLESFVSGEPQANPVPPRPSLVAVRNASRLTKRIGS